MEIIKPPRALWLNFPMGRPMGKPNDPEFQKKVIRVAFELFQKSATRNGKKMKANQKKSI